MLSSPSQTRRVRGYNRTTNNCDCIAHSILVFLDSFLSVLNLQHKDNRSIVEAGKGPIFNSQHFPTPRWIPACSISDIFGAAILYRHRLRQSPKPSGGNNRPCTMSSGIILLHIRFPAFSNPPRWVPAWSISGIYGATVLYWLHLRHSQSHPVGIIGPIITGSAFVPIWDHIRGFEGPLELGWSDTL